MPLSKESAGVTAVTAFVTVAVSGCAWFSGTRQKIEDSCNELGGRDASFCECYAGKVAAELSADDLEHLLAVNNLKSGATLNPNISIKNMEQLVRVGKVSTKARLTCTPSL